MGHDPIRLTGKILRGHGVASGRSENTSFEAGTISLQAPFFAEGGLDLSGFHLATLNLSTEPLAVRIVKPAFHFPDVRWTDRHGPESFDIINVVLMLGDRGVVAWGYRPTPETKAAHPQPDSVLEVIAPFLEEIPASGLLEMELDPRQVVVRDSGEACV